MSENQIDSSDSEGKQCILLYVFSFMFGFSNIIVAEPRRESGPTRNLRP